MRDTKKLAIDRAAEDLWAFLGIQFRSSPKTFLLGAAMLWGAAIVLFHFFQVGYLPILVLSDLFGVTLAAATVGALLLLSVIFLMLLPGYVLTLWARLGVGPRTRTIVTLGHIPVEKWKYRDFSLWTVLGAVIAAGLHALLLITKSYALLIPSLIFSVIPPLVVYAVADLAATKSNVVAWLKNPVAFLLLQICCYFFWWAIASTIIFIWRGEDSYWQLLFLGFLLSVSLFLHLLMLAADRRSVLSKVTVVGGIAMYFLLATGALSAGAAKVVNYFDLGQVSRVNIVLTRVGCDTVNAAWSKRPCVAVHGGATQAFLLSDVDLLTRIGSFYLIGERGTANNLKDRRMLKIAIRSEDVLGWSRVPDDNPPP